MRLSPRLPLRTIVVVAACLTLGCSSVDKPTDSAPTDPLPGWKDTPSKRSILAFVEKVTPDYVPPAARIATFDNDGTLWSEQPLYFQAARSAMLEWTAAGAGPRLCPIVRHTDADREWSYDRKSHVGRLDRALDVAKTSGWTVVDMKQDWRVVYPHADGVQG